MTDHATIEFPVEHKISEVICISCGRRWIAARPESVRLKDLECICGNGNVIETGETISRKEDNDGDQVLQ